MREKEQKASIAIIGGGVAGTTTALYLGQLGFGVTLFEREQSLISGPPFCHLHAGGNLYREISDQQCIALLKQSIDFLRFYPFIVDYRPTVIAIPTEDSGSPADLLPRLALLAKEYEKLIHDDPRNKALGEPRDYYRVYEREQIEALSNESIAKEPKTLDEWMIPVAQNIDLDKVQFPLIIVHEYGLNLFRLSAGVTLALGQIGSVEVLTETTVSSVQKESGSDRWVITYDMQGTTNQKYFDYLVNAAGFRAGKIDDMAGVECKSMVEFKAAYISQWEGCCETFWPEVIFHGERGTPRGMGQFTPYPDGYFQLHAMTTDITLYEDGLVANTKLSCQPKLKQNFIEKIEKSWSPKEIEERTKSAIRHLSQYIPKFSNAKVGSKPLYGAQQIPGDDPTLRVAEVSFPAKRYARCEIVKVSSVLDMIDAITKELATLGYVTPSVLGDREIEVLKTLDEAELGELAKAIAGAREYPKSLADRTVPRE